MTELQGFGQRGMQHDHVTAETMISQICQIINFVLVEFTSLIVQYNIILLP